MWARSSGVSCSMARRFLSCCLRRASLSSCGAATRAATSASSSNDRVNFINLILPAGEPEQRVEQHILEALVEPGIRGVSQRRVKHPADTWLDERFQNMLLNA